MRLVCGMQDQVQYYKMVSNLQPCHCCLVHKKFAVNIDLTICQMKYLGSSTKTVAFQVYKIFKIDHEILQFLYAFISFTFQGLSIILFWENT